MSPLRAVYLALAIWGAVHPMYYFRDLHEGRGHGPVGVD